MNDTVDKLSNDFFVSVIDDLKRTLAKCVGCSNLVVHIDTNGSKQYENPDRLLCDYCFFSSSTGRSSLSIASKSLNKVGAAGTSSFRSSMIR